MRTKEEIMQHIDKACNFSTYQQQVVATAMLVEVMCDIRDLLSTTKDV